MHFSWQRAFIMFVLALCLARWGAHPIPKQFSPRVRFTVGIKDQVPLGSSPKLLLSPRASSSHWECARASRCVWTSQRCGVELAQNRATHTLQTRQMLIEITAVSTLFCCGWEFLTVPWESMWKEICHFTCFPLNYFLRAALCPP